MKEDDDMKKKLLNAVKLFGYFFVAIVYLEVLFKIRVLSFSFDMAAFRISVFTITYAFMIMFFLMFFKEKTVKIMSYFLIVIVTFLYFNQEIYSSFVEGFYSFTVAGDFTAGLSFFSDYLTAITLGHLTYLVPVLSLLALSRLKLLNFDVEYCILKQPLVLMAISFGFFFLSLQTIDENREFQNDDGEAIELNPDEIGTLISYSDMDLYTHMYNSQEALKKFGLLTYTQRDFFSLFRTNPLSEKAYKVLIDDYIGKRDDHNDGPYDFASEFEGKNFILIMAESLDTYAINETLTPNLYSLKTNYAYFENWYSPLYYRSTADSEFLVQTSMFPDKDVTLSMDAYMNNTFPNTLPKLFKDVGYNTYSFHNYFDYFYPRGNFHLNTLGYEQFWGSEELGITSGFDPDEVIFDHVWQSDYDLMQAAVPKFINDDDPFFVNMLTVSGHFQYSENHEMAKPEYVAAVQDYLDNLEEPVEYNDEILYYLAVQMELDKAIGYLIDELENAEKMDDTVIMIFGDHYAYGIDKEAIWAYDDGHKTDGDDMDIHNVPMMIISDSTSLRGVREEYISTIDVIPTISNLFGLSPNYQQIFGHDALNTDRNIVRFADGSFVCKDFRYDSLSENYTITDPDVSEFTLYTLNNKFINDYMYDTLILEYDFYKKDEEE